MSEARRSDDKGPRKSGSLVSRIGRGEAADAMVVLGTRRVCQPPRLLENYKVFSRGWNSARRDRGFVSCADGVPGRDSAGRNWIAVAGLFIVWFVLHVRAPGAAVHPAAGGFGRTKRRDYGGGPAYRDISPRVSPVRCAPGSHRSNRGLLERGRRVARRSGTGCARPRSASRK